MNEIFIFFISAGLQSTMQTQSLDSDSFDSVVILGYYSALSAASLQAWALSSDIQMEVQDLYLTSRYPITPVVVFLVLVFLHSLLALVVSV
jgi:hypothetical protein